MTTDKKEPILNPVLRTKEKQAVTICMSVATYGELLLFQAICVTKRYKATPSKSAIHYNDTIDVSFWCKYG